MLGGVRGTVGTDNEEDREEGADREVGVDARDMARTQDGWLTMSKVQAYKSFRRNDSTRCWALSRPSLLHYTSYITSRTIDEPPEDVRMLLLPRIQSHRLSGGAEDALLAGARTSDSMGSDNFTFSWRIGTCRN